MPKSDERSLIKPSSSFFETVDQLQDKIRRRAYEIFEERDEEDGDRVADWFAAEADVLSDMALHVEEEDGQYIVEGDFPDFEPDEIDVQIEGNTLSVAGTHSTSSSEETDEGTTESHSEINVLRRMSLSDDIDEDRVEAHFEDGKLRVIVPRRRA